MKYKVTVVKVTYELREGLPLISNRRPLFSFGVETTTTAEIDLLYTLTDPRAKFINEAMRKCEDGHYILVFEKESYLARTTNKPIYKYFGYALTEKILDHIHWETKYMNVGSMSVYNLQGRDIQHEVRRGHWKDVTGTHEDKADLRVQETKTKTNTVYTY